MSAEAIGAGFPKRGLARTPAWIRTLDNKCYNTYIRNMTDLQQEIRQTRPFTSAEQEAHLSIVRTASLLTDGLEQVLKPAGLTTAQYNVLRILRGAEPNGLCRNEVRDRMLTRMPDMTRLLDRMEATGLVSRRGTQKTVGRRTRITAAACGYSISSS